MIAKHNLNDMDVGFFDIIGILENAERIGGPEDVPEGTKYIQISDTLARIMANALRTAQTPWKRISMEFIKEWMNTWDDDCSSFGPSLQQVIDLRQPTFLEGPRLGLWFPWA